MFLMTFTRRRTPIIGSYCINDIPVSHCGNSVRDVRYYLTRSLNPGMHVEKT